MLVVAGRIGDFRLVGALESTALNPCIRETLFRLPAEEQQATHRRVRERQSWAARTSALVMVHRAVLVQQWRETVMRFLRIRTKGDRPLARAFPAAHRKVRHCHAALTDSLGNLAAALAGYGVVIVDECHHVPATSFEMVLKACPSRRVY